MGMTTRDDCTAHFVATLSSPFVLPSLLSSCVKLAKHRPPARFSTMAALSDDPIHEWIFTVGKATEITRISPVGGGCINNASRYDTDCGFSFVKTNSFHFIAVVLPKLTLGLQIGLNFFAEHRLGYQLELALKQYGDSNKYEKDGHNESEFGRSWCVGFGGSFYNSYFEGQELRCAL